MQSVASEPSSKPSSESSPETSSETHLPVEGNSSDFNALQLVLRFAAFTFTLALVPLLAIQSKAFDIDPDIWWHIRVGDWIAQHHALPRFGIFSQHAERPWTAYSWGFDLLVSGLHGVFGLPAIPGMLLCLEILISLAFLLALRRIGGDSWWNWWIATAGIVALYVDSPRPVLLTLLFFTIEMLLIFDAERTGGDKLLYWMGPLFVLWANCHIQFVYGLAVLGLYVGSRILSAILIRNQVERAPQSSILQLAGIFGMAVVGACIGPNGWRPYAVALGYVNQKFIYQEIQEMTAMSFRRPEHFVELFLVMAACFVLGRSRRHDFFRPALLLLTAAVSFRSMRDMWFVAIAASFVTAEAVGERRGSRTEWPAKWPKWETASYALAAIVALIVSFGYGMGHGMRTPDMVNFIDRIYPVRATAFASDSHLQGPMYNDFNWGGFLIFNLRDQPVSIDGRNDLYGDELLRRAVDTAGAVNWQSDPDLARANFVLLDRTAPLAAALSKEPTYRTVYQDHIAIIFARQQAVQ